MSLQTLIDKFQSSLITEVYRFVYVSPLDNNVYRDYYLTSGDFSTDEITSYQMERSSIELSVDPGKGLVNLTVPIEMEVSQLFLPGAPGLEVWCTVYLADRLDINTNWKAVFSGRVTTVEWAEDTATLHLQHVASSLDRGGIRRFFGASCSWVYGEGYMKYGGRGMCTVSPTYTSLTIQAGSVFKSAQNKIFAPALNGYSNVQWHNGRVKYTNYLTGYPEFRHVINFAGSTLILNQSLYGFPATSNWTADGGPYYLEVRDGCDHTFNTCKSKSGGGHPFSGCPFTSNKQPFGSGLRAF